MSLVFADSGYWIALWSPRDSLHERAVALAERLAGDSVLTTELVLVEVLDGMAGTGEQRRVFATQMVNVLDADPDVEIAPISSKRFWAAFGRYANRPDQRWSLTDCDSFLVMEERGITEALAYDRDFIQAGFKALLRDESDPDR